MVREKVLIIEGAKDSRNGILRQGFHKLLIQKLEGKMPRIIMGEGKKQAIDKFLNYRNGRIPYLLIDLDKEQSKKGEDLVENNLNESSEVVYFMVQEMEAWFLSQPQILDDYFGIEISKKIPKKPAYEIPNPSDFLNDLIFTKKKQKYHKVIHAVNLLQKLNADKLMDDFEDFGNLINSLKN